MLVYFLPHKKLNQYFILLLLSCNLLRWAKVPVIFFFLIWFLALSAMRYLKHEMLHLKTEPSGPVFVIPVDSSKHQFAFEEKFRVNSNNFLKNRTYLIWLTSFFHQLFLNQKKLPSPVTAGEIFCDTLCLCNCKLILSIF